MATYFKTKAFLNKSSPKYSVNLNIVLSGSKKMSDDEMRYAVENEPQTVNVSITDTKTGKVLVTDIVEMKQFSTGSVGYGLQRRDVTFKESE